MCQDWPGRVLSYPRLFLVGGSVKISGLQESPDLQIEAMCHSVFNIISETREGHMCCPFSLK